MTTFFPFERFLEEQFELTKTPKIVVKDRTFSSVLYQLFRCTLSHEADLGTAGEFVTDPTPAGVFFQLTSLDPLGFKISHSTIIMIADLVARAPECSAECTDVHGRTRLAHGALAAPTKQPERATR